MSSRQVCRLQTGVIQYKTRLVSRSRTRGLYKKAKRNAAPQTESSFHGYYTGVTAMQKMVTREKSDYGRKVQEKAVIEKVSHC